MSIEAMKQALEALESAQMSNYGRDWVWPDTAHPTAMAMVREAITALRQAIEQVEQAPICAHGVSKLKCDFCKRPEQAQPVAWRTFDGEGGYDYRDYHMNEDYAQEWAKRNPLYVGWVEPLYTTPPQRQHWVGLTGDEVNEFAAGCHLGNSVQGAIRKAEAKLKEKNT
jgi:hypothetical protein